MSMSNGLGIPSDLVFMESSDWDVCCCYNGIKCLDCLMSTVESELHYLRKSAFAKPFYFQPSPKFGEQIFKADWNNLDFPKCFHEVITANESVKVSINQCLEILERHEEFYKTNPDETHDKNYSSDELVCLAQHLRNKINKLGAKQAKQDFDSDPVNVVFEKLKEMFPNTDKNVLFSKSKNHVEKQNGNESGLDLTEVIEDILSFSPRSNECKIFPFYPTKYHNFEETNVSHFYIASSQFYKMSLQNPPILAKPINNPFQAIQSIEYIENDINADKYQQCKERLLKKSRELAKEVLLFHGTNVKNIDNIFTTNFKIDCAPLDRPKAMVYGRGVYLSEYPGVSLTYGNGLLLCKVLVGCIETISMDENRNRTQDIGETFDTREVVKDGVPVMYVIKNTDQILPYCVINLQQNNSNNFLPTSSPTKNSVLTNMMKMNSQISQQSFSNLPSPVQSQSSQSSSNLFSPSSQKPPAPAGYRVMNPLLNTSPSIQQLSVIKSPNQTLLGPQFIPGKSLTLWQNMGIQPPWAYCQRQQQGQLCAKGNTTAAPHQSSSTSSGSASLTQPVAPSVPATSRHTTSNNEYEEKIQELQKYVEPLKKKLENTNPTQYKKLQKLLELITSPSKKKTSLGVLTNCEKVLKKCFSPTTSVPSS